MTTKADKMPLWLIAAVAAFVALGAGVDREHTPGSGCVWYVEDGAVRYAADAAGVSSDGAHLGQYTRQLSAAVDGATRCELMVGGAFRCLQDDDVSAFPGVAHGRVVDPALSPGGRLAWAQPGEDTIDSDDIWVSGIGATEPRRITNDPRLEASPTWATDSVLYYTASGSAPGSSVIRKFDFERNDDTVVLENWGRCMELDATPEGRLVFSSDVKGSFDLWVLDPGSSEPRIIANTPALEGEPAWSPDGSRIAYIERTGNMTRLVQLELESGVRSVLAEGPSIASPAWTRGDCR